MYFGYIFATATRSAARPATAKERTKVRRRRDVLKLLALRLVVVESQCSKARCYIEKYVHCKNDVLFVWQVFSLNDLSTSTYMNKT